MGLFSYKYDKSEKRLASMLIMGTIIIFFVQANVEVISVSNNTAGISVRINKVLSFHSLYYIKITIPLTFMFFEDSKFKKASIVSMIIVATFTIQYALKDVGCGG